MTHLSKFLVVAGVLVLSACQTTDGVTPQQQLSNVCQSYASVLTSVVDYGERGLISLDDLQRVDRIDATINPICNGDLDTEDGQVDYNTAIGMVQEALLDLAEAKENANE